MFEVHIYTPKGNHGRVSCILKTRSDAEQWIKDWKAVNAKFENDDLRIIDKDDELTFFPDVSY
jgi:hypothetical protein